MHANLEQPPTAEEARICVTGWDNNRPDDFPGLGDFIGWAGGLARMPNGDLLLAHSAGYWHASFASPRLIAEATRKSYAAGGWPLDFVAPTGGRSMAVRSADQGKTWSKSIALTDLPLDDSPVTLFVCHDGTVLCFINVQASWYGFDEAPPAFRQDLNGLNTQQCVIRSTDNGETWSQPIWLESPGSFYERSHGQAIQLPDGGIVWPTYCSSQGDKYLFGAIHRSDDSGQTWRTVSTIRRSETDVDEPAIARFDDGQLVMVCRPDGGIFFSDDDGVNWRESGQMVQSGTLKAPRLFVLRDGTLVCVATYHGGLYVFLSRDRGVNWTEEIPLDVSSYGYPGGLLLADESLLISYCESGRAPNRVYVIRFRVTPTCDGIQLLHVHTSR
ncbi:MAG: sialidase family protein [Candidatus Poribacteria bacterium]|nr:sialidase family protein [Candidatus Poribacteria bacterium]